MSVVLLLYTSDHIDVGLDSSLSCAHSEAANFGLTVLNPFMSVHYLNVKNISVLVISLKCHIVGVNVLGTPYLLTSRSLKCI